MFHTILSMCLFCSSPVTHAIETDNLRLIPVQETIQVPATLKATMTHVELSGLGSSRSMVGTCPQVAVSLTDSDFGPGQYILQAGFEEGESLGAIYEVPADQFPIKVDLMEVLFATSNAVVQTTTHWSVSIWDGTPTNGFLVASFASDDLILPHLVMPPGTSGMIISVLVDPDDPEQIYVYNKSGMNSFTVAFTVEQHNSPGTPCISAPDQYRNAFPCTDTSGLQFPNHNVIEAVDGFFCLCGAGWFTFQEFPSKCTPSGDWVLRSFYSPTNCNVDPVACCFGDSCTDFSPAKCATLGGTASAEGSSCATYVCGSGEGACCVESTGNCVEFDAETCVIVGGIHMGEGTQCASTNCFPQGACCLENGSCIGPITPEDCVAVNGSFQGDGSSCSSTNCPQPVGACCSSTWCLNLTDKKCSAVGGNWSGGGTECISQNGCSGCPEDINGDGSVNVQDLLAVISDWGLKGSPADVDGSGVVDTTDLLAVISEWGPCG